MDLGEKKSGVLRWLLSVSEYDLIWIQKKKSGSNRFDIDEA